MEPKQTKQKEMKRFISMIVAACAFFAASAQNQLATLSHDGELTAFTGIYALGDAIDASVNGDIIYLSEGEFAQRGSSFNALTIDKKITIIGCGYNSSILPTVHVYTDTEDLMMDSESSWVLFDGVRIGELGFALNNWEGTCWNGEVIIKNSSIDALDPEGAGKILNIYRCRFSNLSIYEGNIEVNIYNSKIHSLNGGARNTNIINTNIKYADSMPENLDACIIGGITSPNSLYSTVHNSLLDNEYLDSSYYNHILCYDCYYENSVETLLDDDLNITIDLQAKGYLGQDGTVIGAYGGATPFSEHPSVPTIDSEHSSVEFDASTNQLNVTITVASN